MQTSTTIYLDHAATAPMWPAAREAMLPWLGDGFANASSLYAAARESRKAVEESREQIASAVGARPEEVIFTSGGTESDNLALIGVAERMRAQGRDTIVVSAIEHHAVLDTADWLESRGFRVRRVPVSRDGVLDIEALRALVDKKTSIVSVMTANNETGVVQPVEHACEIARAAGARFHTDAVQALPWIAIPDADLITITAHKAGGPKGIGALVIRRGVGIDPILHGGGQERGLRSGTYNVAGIAGFGAAVGECARIDRPRVRAMRDHLQAALTMNGVDVTGAHAQRLPNSLHLTIDGVEAEPLLLLLDAAGIAASSGSACASGAADPSHVLLAMGISKNRALGALRLTLGWGTSQSDVDAAAAVITAGIGRLRR